MLRTAGHAGRQIDRQVDGGEDRRVSLCCAGRTEASVSVAGGGGGGGGGEGQSGVYLLKEGHSFLFC